MNILSIQDGYNASASLMVEGKIILALQEERFNEIKNYTGYPYQSIKYCLEYLKRNERHSSNNILNFICYVIRFNLCIHV